MPDIGRRQTPRWYRGATRRRHRPGKTGDHAIRLARARRDAQSAQPCACRAPRPRLGRRGRRRHAAARARQPDRRLGDPPAASASRRRLQAVLSAAADGRHEMLPWSLDTVGLFAKVSPTRPSRCRRDHRPRSSRRRTARRQPAVIAIVRAHWDKASAAMQDAVERRACRRKSGAKIGARAAADPRRGDSRASHHPGLRRSRARLRIRPEPRPPRARAAPPARRGRRDRHRRSATMPAAPRAARSPARPPRRRRKWCSPSAPGAAPHGLGSTGEPTFNRLWTLLGTPCVNAGTVGPGGPAARRASHRAVRAGSVRARAAAFPSRRSAGAAQDDRRCR